MTNIALSASIAVVVMAVAMTISTAEAQPAPAQGAAAAEPKNPENLSLRPVTVCPGKTWETRKPEEVGMDGTKLDTFRDFVGGRGCVVRHGYMVYSWGDVSRRADVASACKPWFSHFLFKAMEEGKLESLDEKVVRWEPRLGNINQGLGYKDREITWRRLANQTSCYQLADKPGTAFAYNDWQLALFWDTLFLKVYGSAYDTVDDQVLHPRLTQPLQCEDNPTMMAFGTKDRPGRVGVSVRDFARFGLLYLRRGRWKDQQLLSEKFATMAVTSPLPNSIPRAGTTLAETIPGQRTMGSTIKPDNQSDHFGSYSWLWWLNGVDRDGQRMFPDAPTDLFGAFGHGGPRAMWVIPSLDLVVSYNDAKLKGWASGPKNPTGHAMTLLLAACRNQPQASSKTGLYFPPPGESLAEQNQRTPVEVGLKPEIISALKSYASKGRWALWRDGYLVHVEGSFNQKQDVASLRKTWHALTVGAAIQQGRIPSYSQKISVWNKELTGLHAEATWWHVITQTSGFDYPYGDYPAFKPGEMWTYSDKNPRSLCNALARVYGKKDFSDRYADVLRAAYFDAIGMTGWVAAPQQDGIRLHLDLEDMGRLGLLALARGQWNGVEVIPRRFVEQLERKQTDGVRVNYNGPDDGKVNLDPKEFPEVPYGFMTWVNTDGDYYPGADTAWAWGAGVGGTYILWNQSNGVVFTGVGMDTGPTTNGIPHVIERAVAGPDPLVTSDSATDVRLTTKSAIHNPQSEIKVSLLTSATTGSRALGPFAKWQRIEIILRGPPSQGRGETNPFSVFVDAIFTAPSGRIFNVPGFYDGDGQDGLDGNIWKARFSADETGQWTFATTSTNALLNGVRGAFAVTAASPDAQGFYRWGRLEAVGAPTNRIRYLKFRDGPYWLKVGCDDPENFLGKSSHYDTPVKRKAAVDYLAGKGINSIYMMTHNIDGDDKDVWPWLGATPAEAKRHGSADARFDVARLAEWLELFDHMQARGVVTYLVLEDDSAWKGYDHARYYREMVARFGHLPALLFNFNEEYNENYRLPQALAFMQALKDLDPFHHPRGIHNVNSPTDAYVDALQVDFTSIQTKGTNPLDHNRLSFDWIQRCQSRQQRVLMVGFDEGRPEEDRRAWWSAYLAGGVWEAHVRSPYDRPMSAWETVWTELGGARAFMESLPFWEMEPANSVVKSGAAFCLAKAGEAYAFYLPEDGEITAELPEGNDFIAAWWNPANGKNGQFQNESRLRGGRQKIVPPSAGDWAVRIVRPLQQFRSKAP